MNFQRKRVATALACVLGATGTAAVTEALAQAPDIRVDVTGSSIRRVEAETALPVTIVTKEEIAKIGAVNTEQLLQTVSAINTLQATQLATGAGLSTYGQASISMRGLGSYRTLVLVNGRRIAPFAATTARRSTSIRFPSPRSSASRCCVTARPPSTARRDRGRGELHPDEGLHGCGSGRHLRCADAQRRRRERRSDVVAGWGNLDKDRFNITSAAATRRKRRCGRRIATSPGPATSTVAGLGRHRAGQHRRRVHAGTGQPSGPFGETACRSPGSVRARSRLRQSARRAKPVRGHQHVPQPGSDVARISLLRVSTAPRSSTCCPEREAYNFSGNFVFKLTNDIQFFADALYAKQTVTNIIQPSPVRRSFYQSDSLFGERGIDRST
jgi:iron complex outermembrane receptor protein